MKRLTVPAEGVEIIEPVNTRSGTHDDNQPSVTVRVRILRQSRSK